MKNALTFLVCMVAFLQAEVLLEVDFRQGKEALAASGLVALGDPLPGTGLVDVPHRAEQGVPRALARNLRDVPLWPDGRLQIARNEVQQGVHRVLDPSVPFDPAEQVLVTRMTTFSDASTGGTNSIGVRLWVQSGLGPNDHWERMELSTHFNMNPRGARQVYPNAYVVRDGWETWAMPEGTNSRRAGIYYRLAEQGLNQEIRGPLAVTRGYYWTWEGLDWPKGWASPLGGGLYAPPGRDERTFPGHGLYTVTAVWARSDSAIPGDPHRFSTRVDIRAPRAEGRVLLDAPLPERLDEVRLILRSEPPAEGRDWVLPPGFDEASELFLGVADAWIALRSRADVNLDGSVDLDDWDLLRGHAGKSDALHLHGDLTGDGGVGLRDAFFLAARMKGNASADAVPPPEAWQATRDGEGRLVLHVPAGGRLYGWRVETKGEPLEAEALQPAFADTAMRETTPLYAGEVDLRHPVIADAGEMRRLNLGPLFSNPDSPARMVVLTQLGSEALTLPVWTRPED